MKLKVGELAELANGSNTNRELVVAELQHRKTPTARRLLAVLDRSDPAVEETELGFASLHTERQAERKFSSRVDRRSGRHANREAASPTEGDDPGQRSQQIGTDAALQARYQSLRATFTMEGEILARWGITAGMPGEFQIEVFDMWRTLLTEGPDRHGWSLADLEADVRSLSAERGPYPMLKGRHRNGR